MDCVGVKRCCGGLIDDVKRKAPWFLSDFTDGLHFQAISSALFIYFTSLANIITFAGVLGAATDQNMVRVTKYLLPCSDKTKNILQTQMCSRPLRVSCQAQ